MKKLTAGLLTAAILTGGTAVFAADGTITSISVDPDTQYIIVTGTIDSENDRDRVTLRVTKNGDIPGSDTVICTYQVNSDESGAYSFGFSMPDGSAAEKYDVYIKADGADAAMKSFKYFGDVSSILNSTVNGASGAAALRSFLEVNDNEGMEMFGISGGDYNDLRESGKSFVMSAVYEIKKDLGGFANGKQLRDAFDQAVLTAQIREGKAEITDDNIAALTVNYGAPKADGYETFKTLYSTVKASDASVASNALRAVQGSGVTDVESFWDTYNNSVTGNIIASTEYWTEVRDFIDENKELIGEHASIDWTKYTTYKQSVCKQLVRGSYSTLDAFASALKSSIDSVAANSSAGSGASGGGGGGSSSGGGASATIKSSSVSLGTPNADAHSGVTAAAASSVKYAFDDLRRTPWANDAVTSLVGRGIVNGYGDGTFRPQLGITRAEFVTLVIRAFYPNAERTDCAFNDVDKSSWAYPYIAAASNLGLVSGVDDSSFAPNANITRQDMAVIIRNVLNETGRAAGAADASAFSDEEAVSDYALDAVRLLRAEGIVNGDDENNFNPRAEATRAESAVIIYNMLNK